MEFKEIQPQNPSDLIILQILERLCCGDIQPGDKLPAEPVLQKQMNVTKQQLKAAFQRLEFYGAIETKPQAGTYIADMHNSILIELVSNVSNLNQITPIESVLESRIALEVHAIGLTAQNITEKDLSKLKELNNKLLKEIAKKNRAVELDILFHMQIVRLAHSEALLALYSILTKDLLVFWKEFDSVPMQMTEEHLASTRLEHQAILDALEMKDFEQAKQAMQSHLDNVKKRVALLRSIQKKENK